MKKTSLGIAALITFVVLFALNFYFALPAINIQSGQFLMSLIVIFVISLIVFTGGSLLAQPTMQTLKKAPVPIGIIGVAFLIGIIGSIIFSPIFNSGRYAQRIEVTDSDFATDITSVDLNNLPLLDRDSTERVGDRVMGQLPELISQFQVSDQYTQVSYRGRLVRVTPLEYNGAFKWLGNRGQGSPGYIMVDSTTGEANLVKLDEGMRYLNSAYFNENLRRKLRFQYPTMITTTPIFEIDDEGNPYYITPVLDVVWIDMIPDVKGAIITNPVDGTSTYYDTENIPDWVDHAYPSSLILSQVNDWGTYQNGWLNSFITQKNVRRTTDGYTYIAEGNDIYIYTGITSAAADESNIGFVLSNLRTKETHFYAVPGAEEYSAMRSAQGAVQEKGYTSTFPLLINLNERPTYLSSLKDAAGLVKAYAFIDVQDYQKVKVTDSTLGLNAAADAYISMMGDTINEPSGESELVQGQIGTIQSVVIEGNSYYYFTLDGEEPIYKASLVVDERLPFMIDGTQVEFKHINGSVQMFERVDMPIMLTNEPVVDVVEPEVGTTEIEEEEIKVEE